MKKGDIVLVYFPFTDFENAKLRPATVLIHENKYGATALSFLHGGGKLAEAGMEYIGGKREQAKQSLQEASQPQELNLGYFGKYKPIEGGASPEGIKEALTTGIKLESMRIPTQLHPVLGTAVAGGTFAGASAIEENKSIPEIILYTAAGTVGGAILGKIAKEVMGKIPFTKIGKMKFNKNAVDAVSPTPLELTPTQYAEKVGETKFTPKRGIFKAQKYIPSEEEISIAQRNADLLQAKDPIKNIESVGNRVMEIDEAVGAYLRDANQIFGKQRLKNYLTQKLEGIGEATGANETIIQKYKMKLIDDISNEIAKKEEGNNLYNVWKVRKEFDRYAEKYLKAFSGNPTLKKDVSKYLRNGLQEFITDELEDNTYKSAMKNMTELLTLIDTKDGILMRKTLSEKGMSSFRLWIRHNPTLARIIGFGGGGLIGYGLYRGISGGQSQNMGGQ